jgi:hypothetical protein
LVLPGADPDRGVSVFTANGDPDRSFDVRGFGSSVITSYTPLPDGRVALAGRFNRAGTGPANGILLLGTNGVPDAAFPGVTKLAPGGAIEIDGNWLQVAAAGNEGLFVLGRIAAPDGGIAFSGLRRIRWDGTVDERGVGRPETVGVSGFSTRDGSLWLAASPEVQQVLDSTPATSTSVADGGFWLTRLEASGLPFPGFQPFPAGLVARLSRLDRSAGILRLGGLRLIGEGRGGAVFVEITTIDGEAMIRRVDPSGNVSGVFLPPPIAGETFGPYFSAALDPVTGQEMQWEVYWNLGRFHSAIELSDGSTLVGGRFARFPGATPGALVLLRSDGQVDAGFKPLAFGVSRPFVDPSVLSIAVDAQDRIYVAGDFDRYGDTPVSGLIRLDRTGRLDPSFASPLTITGYPEPAADLRLIGSSLWVGGSFRSADETFPRALWKLDIGPTPAAPTIAWSMADGGRVLLTWRSEPGLVLEVSNDLSGNGHWLGNPLTVSDSEGASRVEIPATMQTAFFRLRRPAP